MLCEAFGEYSLSWTAVFQWHSCFKVGQVSVEDDDHSGRPSTSKTTENVEKIRELIHEERRRTIHELADAGGISFGICQEIITENLNMRRISAKFVPRLLTNDQKQRRINVCLELQDKAKEDRIFISRIITGDESWIYGYDPQTKQQSSQCLTSKGNRKRYSTALRKMTSTVLLKRGKNDGIGVYVPKETILKEMAAKIE
jgi:hypothetical protein